MLIGEKIVGRFEPLGDYAKSLGKNFAPKVSVSVAADPTWKAGQTVLPRGMIGPLVALVDTGSDVTRIDTAIVKKLGLKPLGQIGSSFTGIQTTTDVFSVQEAFPAEGFVIGGQITAADLRATGNYHDAIVGLDVISFFDLEVSAKRQIVELTFAGT